MRKLHYLLIAFMLSIWVREPEKIAVTKLGYLR